MMYLGTYTLTSTVVFRCSIFNRDGSSLSSGLANFRIFKDDLTSPKSGAGPSQWNNANTCTIEIDLSMNDDAGFFEVGHEYQLAVQDTLVDGQNISTCLAMFSIVEAGKPIGGSRVS